MNQILRFLLISLLCVQTAFAQKHSFIVGDESFLLDGKPLQMISGEMHCARVPIQYWRDRMKMAKAMGLNTIGTYVFWNAHEPMPGKYDFSGNNNIAEFVRIAKEEGLWVVLRPSPYACAEWEFGGYPWWLLKDSSVKVRSKDPRFIAAYTKYIQQLSKQLVPLLVTNGGNILMVQIENEYGSYSDDKSYLDLNRKIFREAGFDGLLFTCDGETQMPKGYLPGYLPAVNGLEDPATVKALINKHHDGKGPYYIAEWYPGWFDQWGKPHARTSVKEAADKLDKILSAGISINMYMFHGGTTRDFMNGANMNITEPYAPQVSSYDYDAPLDEAGNPTEKYYAFREVIARHLPAGVTLPAVPAKNKTIAISHIPLTGYAALFDQLPAPVVSEKPLSFEDLNQAYGYVLYRCTLNNVRDGYLKINGLRDYAVVYVNGNPVGKLDRRLEQDSLPLMGLAAGTELSILVENNGRINYGPYLTDNRKGIIQQVSLNGRELRNWKMYRFPLNNVAGIGFKSMPVAVKRQPALYKGSFTLAETGDTYLDMRPFGKGIVFLNGHHLGKYWEIGPQQTLYVPAGWLNKGLNEIVIFDLLKTGHHDIEALSAQILDKLNTANTTTSMTLPDARYPLIPYPQLLKPGTGAFMITPATVIVSGNSLFKKEAALLGELFTNSFGKPLQQKTIATGTVIRLVQDNSFAVPESYGLLITGKEVILSAATPEGIFRAIQTIRQLLPAGIEKAGGSTVTRLSLPALQIRDEPVYAWRGMHLDVSRHFFSIDYLEKMIDLMALYKFNKFHFHLTDDQGWRVEIKKYPKLTEEGAWRSFNNQDSVCMKRAVDNPDFAIDPRYIVQKDGKTRYGGFYTQEQLKKLVAYAAARHITIIPEIDMPGHMMAAINSYNYLSCNGKSAFGELFSTPVCPCLPGTFEFAKDVYTEIMDIFPSEYLHIGGDEVERSSWAQSDACKKLMAEKGFKTTAELQSYFIKEMEQFFHSKGRKLIGWDEILEGGVSNTAAIMYWRTWVPKAPVEAAQHGNQVIMTPGSPLYFDTPPDKNSLSKIYHFNPIPDGLTLQQSKLIMGAQANTWTEYVPTENRADYLLMPRMTALAEMLWTRGNDYESYLRRLNTHYARLNLLNVHYRLPDLPGLLERYAFTDYGILNAHAPTGDLTIRYTIDSTAPTSRSKVLTGPVFIKTSQWVRLAAFTKQGARGDVYDLHYQQQSLATPVQTFAPVKDGLRCSWIAGSFKNTAGMQGLTENGVAVVAGVEVPKAAETPSFGLQYRGFLDAPEDGIYTFFLTCDDGGRLVIADREVVDNDGLHAPQERNGQVALRKGLHPFALDFIEGGGGYTLKLQYSLNGSAPKDLPAAWLKN
jgi:hexosaminidase